MRVGFPSEQEFTEWKEHPVTKALLEMLEKERDVLRRQWEGGSFTDYEKDAFVLTNVNNVGYCRGLTYVCELNYVTLATRLDVPLTKEELENDK